MRFAFIDSEKATYPLRLLCRDGEVYALRHGFEFHWVREVPAEGAPGWIFWSAAKERIERENGSAICDVGAVEVPEPGFFLQLATGAMELSVARCRCVAGRAARSARRAVAA